MNIEHKEKRLMEAFAQYESGESLATLQTLYSDVAVELNQMAEAEQALKQGREAMHPGQELGRKIVAALVQRSQQHPTSIFMSSLWRLTAPVGVAALALMFILSSHQAISPTPAVTEQMNMANSDTAEADAGALRMAAPMMAKNAEISLMTVTPERSEGENIEPEAVEVSELVPPNAANWGITPPEAFPYDPLYYSQMLALGLLLVLSLILFLKHLAVRRARA